MEPDHFMRRLAILGSTGSIGRQTLDVVRSFPEHFQVVALATGSNVELLAEQVQEFKPIFVACYNESKQTMARLHAQGLTAQGGPKGLLACATHPEVDMVMVAMSGGEGITPLLAAITVGKQVALANKETLVMGGHLVMQAAHQSGVDILPIDSEHSAIWQCLRGERPDSVLRLVLTASGGPFLRCSLEEMYLATVGQTLSHPIWKMGPKVTIDSATLMNKGLEVIEAHWLFHIAYESIEVIIHPQSIIHSMVEFVDGSIKMQASQPNMHLPIQDALSYPYRLTGIEKGLIQALHLPKVACLNFEAVDWSRFPCLQLAYAAGRCGGTAPTVLAGADEQAVKLFQAGKLGLTDIAATIEKVLSRHTVVINPDLETILETVAWSQEEVLRVQNSVRV